jgi:hypothetical protein
MLNLSGIKITAKQMQHLLSYPHQVLAKSFSKTVSPLSLILVLGATAGSWLGIAAIAPLVVQASTNRVAIAVVREPGESYQTLIRRAEAAARTVAQRTFDNNSQISDVAITIIGESEGLAAPLLTLEVSRAQWRSRPDPQRWATYYQTARALLQMEQPSTPTEAGQPTVSPDQPPSAPPQPVPTIGQPVPAQPASTTSAPTVPTVGQPTSTPQSPATAQPSTTPSSMPTPSAAPNQSTPTQSPPEDSVDTSQPPGIEIPAAPSGQLGLPRSILE